LSRESGKTTVSIDRSAREEDEMKPRSAAFALAVVFTGLSAALAQNYPSRPVTMVVPFAAGGPVDTIARIVGTPMGKTLGQTILVENVVGASGTLGVGRVARAAPDGYTLSIGHWARTSSTARFIRCSTTSSVTWSRWR